MEDMELKHGDLTIHRTIGYVTFVDYLRRLRELSVSLGIPLIMNKASFDVVKFVSANNVPDEHWQRKRHRTYQLTDPTRLIQEAFGFVPTVDELMRSNSLNVRIVDISSEALKDFFLLISNVPDVSEKI